MKQITQSMARLEITPEMLETIDVPGIINGFRHDFKKLGEFKRARDKHESRNALSRWWHSDELKDAQLNSIELQESFSKKLGQLMVISVAMSQQLNDQQQSLSEQQASLQKQTFEIASANKRISHQQQELSDQQDKLKKLIDNYFELKGLTANQAEQLIQIASGVKSTKERMIASFEQERNAVLAMKSEMEATIFQQNQSFQLLSEKQNQRMSEILEEVNRTLDEDRIQAQQKFDQAAVAATELQVSIREQLRTALENVAEQVSYQTSSIKKSSDELESKVKANLQATVSDIDSQFAQYRIEVQGTISSQSEQIEVRCNKVEQSIQRQGANFDDAQQRLYKEISRLKWFAAISGVGSVMALIWLAWMHIGI